MEQAEKMKGSGTLFFAVARGLSDNETVSFAAGCVGFILSFVAVGITERHRRDRCDINIVANVTCKDEN